MSLTMSFRISVEVLLPREVHHEIGFLSQPIAQDILIVFVDAEIERTARLNVCVIRRPGWRLDTPRLFFRIRLLLSDLLEPSLSHYGIEATALTIPPIHSAEETGI